MMQHEIIFDSDIETPEGLEVRMEQVIAAALKAEGVALPCEINVLITDDEGIHQINLDMRDVDRPTDVLSFPMYDMRNGDMPLPDEDAELGDIVLSLERAEEQANEFGHSYERECAFLTVHSMLHLLGYDHVDSEEDDREMREHQRVVMKKIGLEVKSK